MRCEKDDELEIPKSSRPWRFTWESLAHIPILRLYLFSPDVGDISALCRFVEASLRLDRSLLLVSWHIGDEGAVSNGRSFIWIPVPRVLINPECSVDVKAMADHIEVKLVLLLPVDHPVESEIWGSPGMDPDRCLPLSLGSGEVASFDFAAYLLCLRSYSADNTVAVFTDLFGAAAAVYKVDYKTVIWFLFLPSPTTVVGSTINGAATTIVDAISLTIIVSVGRATKDHLANLAINGTSSELEESTTLLGSLGAGTLVAASFMVAVSIAGAKVGEATPHFTFSTFMGVGKTNSDCLRTMTRLTSMIPTLLKGTCLLDRASVAVCEHDLEGAVLERTVSDFGMKSSESNDTSSMRCDLVSSRAWSDTSAHEVDSSSNSNQLGLVGTQNDINMDCLKANLNNFSLNNEKSLSESIVERTSKCDFHCCIAEKVQHAGGTEYEASIAACNAQQSLKVYGSGFMVTSANLSNDVECVEFSCRNCSSPLGSYSCVQGTTAPVVGGVRLFKCYISTSVSTGAPDDAFKTYTLESIFTNLLIEGAQEELSFRTMVCDLRTRFPMLQIVLLNSRAWCCSGHCYENAATRGLPAIHMQPVVKVLFSDCSASTDANSVVAKDRSVRNGTEEVYMMNREIEGLTRSLKSSIAKLPHSCSSLQGMSLSFLGR
ncbi:hypothetical protein MA16_Dca001969 [Dendrobium catenatum]|uniref:Uncharacterized protein n=2 Tax=Dendrobium catenatum TaxID=906689 RepID=A0A2I0XDZ6_9ASPA|nr:hypothetical protein MA16_Dca001969 [Dendrobium catenatum]